MRIEKLITITTIPDISPPTVGHRPSLASRALSRFITYGAALVVIPAIVGGLVMSPLHFAGLSMGPATAIGLTAGYIIGIRQLIEGKREQAEFHRKIDAQSTIDRERGELEVITVTGIIAALSVDDLEDFGPGYLLRTRDDELIYLAGEMLWSENEGEIAEAVEATRRPGTKELLNFHWSGKPVPVVDSIGLNKLGLDEWIGCEVVSSEKTAELIARWPKESSP